MVQGRDITSQREDTSHGQYRGSDHIADNIVYAFNSRTCFYVLWRNVRVELQVHSFIAPLCLVMNVSLWHCTTDHKSCGLSFF